MRPIQKFSQLFAFVVLFFLAASIPLEAKNRNTPPAPKAIPTSAAAARPASESKPELETLLKPKSIKKILEDYDIVTNSEWPTDDDFAFVNAVLVRTPLTFVRPKMVDYSIYPKVSDAIKKISYDPKTQIVEIIGETHGLHMHSWARVDQRLNDVIRYEIIRGDMVGFKINIFLWDREGKTLTVAKGFFPGAKQMLPTLVSLVFKPVSEIVLAVATKNFRGYIEEEYKKQKLP